ncbi:hypothetical protein TWF506_011004 [Arthrobotrys conoides]|uniref:Uncharacterized protein n=1 Tax=Arthrobotrys conoides TaxID=74498 RepID=A0AAN8N5K6_9PEZI
MCTDYEIWYACGHKGHPARPGFSQLSELENAVYANRNGHSPTARVSKHCARYKESGMVCQIQDRLVVTQRWEIVCCDVKKDCKPIKKFSDSDCEFLKKNLESSAIAGQRYLNSLTEKERAELYKTSARISQPPVWGRKGPHVKKPRKVKTKEERERDKDEKERAKAQKEAEKTERLELAAARALTDLASGKPKGGRKKGIKIIAWKEPVAKKMDNRKLETTKVGSKLYSTKKKRKKKKLTMATKLELGNTQSKRSSKRKAAADEPSKPAPKRQHKEKTA